MKLIPLLLDSRPRYLGVGATDASLLQLPVGQSHLVLELVKSVQKVTAHPPIVVAPFAPDQSYDTRMRTLAPIIEAVTTPTAFKSSLTRYDPSDFLLMVSPSLYPKVGFDLRPLMAGAIREAPMVRHLLAFETSSLRTKEFVHSEDGRVRRIQRYFEPVTWPFASGVVASLVPIASLMTTSELPTLPLDQLRRALALAGVPSQDVPCRGECFDLSDETGALALNEFKVLSSFAHRDGGLRQTSGTAARAGIDATARFLGPVLVHEGVVVEEGALVIGPAVLGARARIKADAVVAHCLVLPGASVAESATVRQRVVIRRTPRAKPEEDTSSQRRHTPGISVPATLQQPSRPTLYPAIKAAVEPIIASVALVVLSPLIVAIGALVKLSSEGPIFFGDLREGKDGRLFRCWKFRTMRVNADVLQHTLAGKQQMDGPQFKMDHDPRVTRVGHWLRRSSLDELPQLFNVVRGDMSCIGPRPSPFNENQICVPWRNARLSVRPGMSGLWQVCRYNRAEGDFHQWIHYDMLYVNNVSLLTDLKIILATFKTLAGRGPISVHDITGVPADYIVSSPSAAEGRAWSQAFSERAVPEGADPIASVISGRVNFEREVAVTPVALADVADDGASKTPVSIPAEWPGLPLFSGAKTPSTKTASEPAN
jgi:lipopolysaccharide/colanic/teichoic acid biosynthesis glycosyltransferase